jgi:hypothetical protein
MVLAGLDGGDGGAVEVAAGGYSSADQSSFEGRRGHV